MLHVVCAGAGGPGEAGEGGAAAEGPAVGAVQGGAQAPAALQWPGGGQGGQAGGGQGGRGQGGHQDSLGKGPAGGLAKQPRNIQLSTQELIANYYEFNLKIGAFSISEFISAYIIAILGIIHFPWFGHMFST